MGMISTVQIILVIVKKSNFTILSHLQLFPALYVSEQVYPLRPHAHMVDHAAVLTCSRTGAYVYH